MENKMKKLIIIGIFNSALVFASSEAQQPVNHFVKKGCIKPSLAIAVNKKNQDQLLIRINGESRLMIDHINKLKADFAAGNENSFRFTHLFMYKNGEFILTGFIEEITDDDLAEIKNYNYLYHNSYAYLDTKNQIPRYKRLGAILIGTKDRLLLQDLIARFGEWDTIV